MKVHYRYCDALDLQHKPEVWCACGERIPVGSQPRHVRYADSTYTREADQVTCAGCVAAMAQQVTIMLTEPT